jgi:hypothetical protein
MEISSIEVMQNAQNEFWGRNKGVNNAELEENNVLQPMPLTVGR